MVFNSIHFLVFFPIVLLFYYIIPRKIKPIWLFVASYYFYMSWNVTYSLLILTSTVVTYLSGILMNKSDRRKLILTVSFVINLGILFTFKYLDFFISNLSAVTKFIAGKPLNASLGLLLPVGISFYTFQALSYTVDVYRGEVEPERNFLDYALFVSFFPQLVAGPIERSGNLLTQVNRLKEERLFNYEKAVSGFIMMCYGMFLKVVLADHLAVFVNGVWDNLQRLGLVEGVFAAVAFSFQIYCDFGAYSIIAIGAARMIGIDLMENFNTPYFAVSIKDFWRRWHISLSTWFRDYLYIPLGGSRCSRIKKYRNIMITFLISGLWHGADWTYVLWGGIHGMYQIVGELTEGTRRRINEKLNVDTEAESYKLGKILGTFVLTTFAWIFFRADTIKDAVFFIRRMITRIDLWALFDGSLYKFGTDRVDFHVICLAFVMMLIVDLIRIKKKEDIGVFLLRQNLVFRWAFLFVLILGTLVYGAYGVAFDSSQFIYFRF